MDGQYMICHCGLDHGYDLDEHVTELLNRLMTVCYEFMDDDIGGRLWDKGIKTLERKFGVDIKFSNNVIFELRPSDTYTPRSMIHMR